MRTEDHKETRTENPPLSIQHWQHLDSGDEWSNPFTSFLWVPQSGYLLPHRILSWFLRSVYPKSSAWYLRSIYPESSAS